MEVIVITEGQTEEAFIKHVIAPSVHNQNIFVKPLLLNTSKDSKGGALNYDRFKFNARNTLRTKGSPVVTSFIDLYALDTQFPGVQHIHALNNVYQKVDILEQELSAAIIEYVGCSSDRFRPHIQPYEFEGILFSDCESLISVETDWQESQQEIQSVINAFESPEHINNSYETKPSARLKNILTPKYKKTRHGPIIAKSIGLNVIESKCLHFKSWMDWLRGLQCDN